MKYLDPKDFDFDIFLPMNAMCHFATAGANIPSQIVLNPFHNDFRQFLKSTQNTIRFEYLLNPNIEGIFSIKSENQNFSLNEFDQQAYLFDFIEFAKKGMFSFDRTYLHESEDLRFHLVAYPFFDEQVNEFIYSLEKYLGWNNLHYFDRSEIQQLNINNKNQIDAHFRNPIDYSFLFGY